MHFQHIINKEKHMNTKPHTGTSKTILVTGSRQAGKPSDFLNEIQPLQIDEKIYTAGRSTQSGQGNITT